MTFSEAMRPPAVADRTATRVQHGRSSGLERPLPSDRPTPYVEVDELRLERNMRVMQEKADAAGVALFPHVKTHKSIHLASRQLQLGAKGITASKPSEAAVFALGGVRSIILAYPIVNSGSLDRLLPLVKANGVELRVIAASETGVEALSTAASRHGIDIGVFLKVDVGLGRVGVKPSDPEAVALCRRITSARGLHFAGLLSHAGHAYAAANREQLALIAHDEATALSAFSAQLQSAGIVVPCISVGATPTCLSSPIPAGVQCIRPGNYVFLDLTALRLGICSADDLALSVVGRVVATNDSHFIIDAGSKSMSSDRGPHGTGSVGYGMVVAADNATGSVWTLERLSEEHGFVLSEGRSPPIGSRVRVFPNHACATIANFDSFILNRTDGDSAMLPVDARSGQT